MTITRKKLSHQFTFAPLLFSCFSCYWLVTCEIDSLSAFHRRNLPWHIQFRLWMENHIAKIFQSSGRPPQWLYWWGSPWNPKQPHALCTTSCCRQASCLDSLWNRLFNKRWNRSKIIVGTLESCLHDIWFFVLCLICLVSLRLPIIFSS